MTHKEMSSMTDNELAVTAVLPEEVNTFEYTRNHHFIRFAKKDGTQLKLIPASQMLYSCPAGCVDFLTDSNHGPLKCPICGTAMVSKWGKEQVCFIPEEETDFEFPKKK